MDLAYPLDQVHRIIADLASGADVANRVPRAPRVAVSDGPPIRFARDSSRMLQDIWQVRMDAWRNRYDAAHSAFVFP